MAQEAVQLPKHDGHGKPQRTPRLPRWLGAATSEGERQGCAVRAYDPSTTTAKWWDSQEAKKLRAAGEDRYKLHKIAAGGQDGPLELFEYNWQQVSIVKEEDDLTREKNKIASQRSFAV